MLARRLHRDAQRTLDLPRLRADRAEILKHVRRRRDGHRKQQVFRAEIVVARVAALLLGQMDDSLRRLTEL